MCLRNPLADRKSEAESATLRHSRPRAIRPPEALENMWNIRGSDSNSRVTHCKRHCVGMQAESKLHLAACRRVLDRICYKIEKKLTKPGGISHDRDVCGERKIHGHARPFA